MSEVYVFFKFYFIVLSTAIMEVTGSYHLEFTRTVTEVQLPPIATLNDYKSSVRRSIVRVRLVHFDPVMSSMKNGGHIRGKTKL